MTCPRCRGPMECLSHRPHPQEQGRCRNFGKIRYRRQRRKDR